MRSHYLFYFLFFLHFILRISLFTASPSLLSSSRPSLHHRSHKPSRRPFSPLPISQAQPLQTILSIADLTSPDPNPFLHRRSHKPSRRPFSPSPISQDQPPQTLLSIADLTSPAAIDLSVSQVSSVGTKTDRASGTGRGCPPMCIGIGVEIGVRWQWLCRVLWYRVEIGFAPVCVGCVVFCGIGLRLGLL